MGNSKVLESSFASPKLRATESLTLDVSTPVILPTPLVQLETTGHAHQAAVPPWETLNIPALIS